MSRTKLQVTGSQVAAQRKRTAFEHALTEFKWRALAASFFTFATYVWVISKREDVEGSEPLDVDAWPHQRELVNQYLSGRNTILLKARQLGASVVTLAFVLWKMLTKPGYNVLWFAQDKEHAQDAIEKLRFQYNSLPAWLRNRGPSPAGDAKTHFELKWDSGFTSSIRAMASTGTTGAGGTVDLVVLDEFALADKAADMWRSLKATTDAGGQILVLSTARGRNFFSWLYQEAEAGRLTMDALFFPWHYSKLIDEEQYEEEKAMWVRQGQPHRFYQERPASPAEAFSESAHRRFLHLPDPAECADLRLQGRLEENRHGEVRFVEDPNGMHSLSIPSPVRSHDYLIAADPSKGVGQDYFAAHLISPDPDGEGAEIIGYLRTNNIEASRMAQELDKLGRLFTGVNGPAMIVVEDQGGHGELVNHILPNELNYPRVWREQHSVGRSKVHKTDRYGFGMPAKRRAAVIDQLAGWIATGKIHNIHSALRTELGAFVQTKTHAGNIRYEAETGFNDDLVLSLAIAVYVLSQSGLTSTRTHPPTSEGEFRISLAEAREQAMSESPEEHSPINLRTPVGVSL